MAEKTQEDSLTPSNQFMTLESTRIELGIQLERLLEAKGANFSTLSDDPEYNELKDRLMAVHRQQNQLLDVEDS